MHVLTRLWPLDAFFIKSVKSFYYVLLLCLLRARYSKSISNLSQSLTRGHLLILELNVCSKYSKQVYFPKYGMSYKRCCASLKKSKILTFFNNFDKLTVRGWILDQLLFFVYNPNHSVTIDCDHEIITTITLLFLELKWGELAKITHVHSGL